MSVSPGWWQFTITPPPPSVDGYSGFGPISRMGQIFLSAQRFNTLLGSDATAPWNSLSDQTSQINTVNQVGFGVLSVVFGILAVANLWMLFTNYANHEDYTGTYEIERTRTLHGTSSAGATREEQTAIDEKGTLAIIRFRDSYKYVLGLFGLLLFVSGLFCFFYIMTPPGLPSNVTGHAWRNSSMMALMVIAVVVIVLSLLMFIKAFSISEDRAEDAIIHPRMQNGIQTFVLVTIGIMIFWTADGTGGQNEEMLWASGFLFIFQGLSPSYAYAISTVAPRTANAYIKHWRHIIAGNALSYTVLLVASILVCFPVDTFRPSFFCLSEQHEYYWWIFLTWIILSLLVMAYEFYVMFAWNCRPISQRDLSVSAVVELKPRQKEELFAMGQLEHAGGKIRRSSSAAIKKPKKKVVKTKNPSR